MFAKIKAVIAWAKDWFDKAMHEKDVNSRMVFLGTFLVTSLIMIAHTVVYLASKTKDPNYATIMTVFSGAHGINGLARFMTKKNSGEAVTEDTESKDTDSKDTDKG